MEGEVEKIGGGGMELLYQGERYGVGGFFGRGGESR